MKGMCMKGNAGITVAEALLQMVQLIEQDRFREASEYIRNVTTQHSEWIDERLQAELQLVMKQMEYKIALKDFDYLRSLALVYKYCEVNYAQAGIERAKEKMLQAEKSGADGLLSRRDTIWWCWLQGLDQAPEIVRRCYDSLGKLGREIIILEDSNIAEYVQLPECITEKYHKGIISRTHYTDLIRLELLTVMGGTWIDATTWISGTQRIPWNRR